MAKPCFRPLGVSSVSFLAALLTAAVAAPAARAQDGAPPAAAPGGAGFGAGAGGFGESGQLAFSMTSGSDFPFSFSKTGSSDWNLHLRPGLDYFIQDHVSLGGFVGIDKSGGSSTVSVGARAGYDLWLGSIVSLWVRGGLELGHTSVNNGPSVTTTALNIDVPFLFHFTPHFLLGVGPFFSLPLSNSAAMASKDPTYGLTALVGGYF